MTSTNCIKNKLIMNRHRLSDRCQTEINIFLPCWLDNYIDHNPALGTIITENLQIQRRTLLFLITLNSEQFIKSIEIIC